MTADCIHCRASCAGCRLAIVRDMRRVKGTSWRDLVYVLSGRRWMP